MVFDSCFPQLSKSSTGECTEWTVRSLSRIGTIASFLQEGGEAASSTASLLYAIEGRSPLRQVQTIVLRRHDTLSLPSHAVNKRPVGGVHLVCKYEAEWDDGGHHAWSFSFNGTDSESHGGQCKESAEVLQELSGPGDLHCHLPLPHLVLHQDLTFHLQP